MIVTAEPLVNPNPEDATQAAPIFPKEPRCGVIISPFLILSMIFSATNLAVIPDGIPVLGGAGKISVPFGDFLGLEIECGGAKAIPGAKILG